MREESDFWAPLIGAITVLVLIGVLALVAAFGSKWVADFLSGQAANWFQALGTILAILAAYEHGRRQLREDRRREARVKAEQEVHQLGVIRALLANALGTVVLFKDRWRERNFLMLGPLSRRQWVAAQSGFRGIDVFLCPDVGLVVDVLQIPLQFDVLLEKYDQYEAAVRLGSIGKTIEPLLAALEDTERMLRESIEASIAAGGHRVGQIPDVEDRREVAMRFAWQEPS